MINHGEGGLICDVITHVKLLHTNCYQAKICSADIHLVENHNNNLYLFMVPMTPFFGVLAHGLTWVYLGYVFM